MIEQHNDGLLKELARLSQALINSLTDIQLPQMVRDTGSCFCMFICVDATCCLCIIV